MSFVIGLVGLSLMVLIHEFGHFLAARMFGVEVLKFSIGMGPKIVGKKIGGTEYLLSALPLGGYCQMKGEEDFAKAMELKAKRIDGSPGSLYGVAPWKRMVIAFAGPFFNLVSAMLLFFVINIGGYTIETTDNRIILASEFTGETDMPADKVGLRTGDRIVAVNGEKTEYFYQILEAAALNADKELTLTVDRRGDLLTVRVTPQLNPQTGGGVIGVELAAVWASAGCQITIVEALDRLVANLDRELSQGLAMELKKSGVEVFTGASVSRIEPGPAVVFTHKGAEHTVSADTVLAATGRRPATEGLFADGAAPELERGFVQVDGSFRTSIPSIYAIGDAIGGAMLAHKAEAEGRAVADLLLGRAPVRGTAPIPSCVYTSPELAQVGLTADQAKAGGVPLVTGKCVLGGNARTLIEGGKRGFVKLVFHKETRALLGACLCCCRATDLISELTLAVSLGLTAEQLLRPVRPHPTFAEAFREEFGEKGAALLG